MERNRATARILLFTFGLQCTVFAQAGPIPQQGRARAVPAPRVNGARQEHTPPPSAPGTPAKLLGGSRTPLSLAGLSPTLGLPAIPGDLTGCEDALLNSRAPVLSVSRSTLWPPNHALVDIGLGFDVTAACSLLVTGHIAVWADEPDESQTGDGDLPGDAQLAAPSLFLRSERKGNADGRVYLLIGTATAGTGVTGAGCATVVVPHGQNPASLNSVRAQARDAQAYCAAHSAAPPAFFKLTEGDLIRPNQPPQVNAGPDQAIAFPGTAALNGTVTDDGLPSGVLNLAWSKLEGPGTVVFSPANGEHTTATFSLPGTYVLRLEASDTHLSANDTVRVEVNAANLAPVVNAGPDQILTLPTNTATLAGSVSDDGLPVGHLNISWSVVDCPVGVTFGDPTQPVTTAAFAGPAQCTLRLSANDGQLASEDTTVVTVNPEPPATLAVADASESEGNEGATGALLSLALSKPWPRAVSVDYMTFDGTANAGCDYRLRYGTATIEPGQTSATILVPIVGELIPEGDETVVVRLGNAVEATLERTQAVLTLRNDDAPNQQPSAPFGRAPGDGATGVAAPPLLSWSATDPDLGDTLTHDVYLGTSFATAGQSWARTCPVTAGPGPRQGAVSGYDEASDRLILFGGTDADPDTMWVLANATGAGGTPEWIAYLAPGGPGGLARAASAYDPATNRLLVHGGCTGDCAAASDETWVLTNANGLGGPQQWTRLAIVGPGARWDHAAAYDATSSRLIVFGGALTSGAEADDLWVLKDVGGAQPTWEALAPAGAAPSARSGAAAVYDPIVNRLIVFGGANADGALNDLWVLTGADGLGGTPEWGRLDVAGDRPGRRFGAAAAYEPVSRRFIVFGGSTEGVDSGTNFVFADTWMLTEANGVSPGAQWIRLSPGGGPPAARFQPAFSYSASANRLIVAGGANNKLAAPPEDHWVLADAVGGLPLVSPNQVETHYTATEAVAGPVYYWRIVTRDGRGAWRGSPTWSFTSNQAPQVDAGPNQTITLPTATVNLAGSAIDDGLPTGSALTLAWSLASGPAPVTFSDPTSVVTTANVSAPGTYVLRLAASDGHLAGSDEVIVDVRPGNQSPIVNAGLDQAIALPTTTARLSGAVSDDGFPAGVLTVAWSQVSGPDPVTFASPTQAQTTVALGGVGTYVLRLTASDGELTAGDDVVVTLGSPVCVAPPPGLVGWWPADGDAGELVAGWAGTPTGGLTFEPGMIGQGFRFDGYDDSVEVTPSPALASDSFTVEAWVNPDDLGSRPLVEFGSSSQYGVHLWEGVASQAQGPAPGTVFANLVSAPATWHYFGTGSYALTPSRWNHVALTYDSVTGRGAIYVNGLLAAEQNLGSFTPSMLLPLNFGYRPNGGQRFKGLLDEVSLYNRALSQQEVETIHLAGGHGKCKDIVHALVVNAGPDAVTSTRCTAVPASLQLAGTVADQSVPPTGTVMATWTKVSGPGTVTFADPTAVATSASFSQPGTYGIRLTGSTPSLTASDDMQAAVAPLASPGGPLVASGILPSQDGNNGPVSVTIGGLLPGHAYTLYLGGSWAFGNGVIGNGTWDVLVSGFANPLVVGNSTLAPFSATAPLVIRRLEGVSDPLVVGIRDAPGWYWDNLGQLYFQLYEGELGGESLLVAAGGDQMVIGTSSQLTLRGTVTSYGDPAGGVQVQWSQVSGPGSVTFSAPSQLATTAQFAASGTYVLRLTAQDCVRTVGDDVTVQVYEPSDLVVATVNTSGVTYDGQTLDVTGNVSAEARNTGAGPALGTFAVAFFEDRNNNGAYDAGIDNLLGSTTSADLPPGAAAPVSAAVSGSVLFRGNLIYAFVDSGDAVPESDETNNVGRSATALPDLTASYARQATAGADLTLTARIGNGGGSAVPASLPVSFYNGDPRAGGSLLGTVATSQTLQPGQFQDVSLTVPLSAEALPLWVSADDQGGLVGTETESDETNNLHNSRLYVSSTPNQPPLVNAGADQTLEWPNATAALAGTATDDGRPVGILHTAWGLVSGPGTVSFGSATTPATTATFSGPGTYVLRLSASDDDKSASDDVTVTVHPPNQAPVVVAGPDQSIGTHSTLLAGSVADDGLPAGSSLSVAWTQLAGPAPVAFGSPNLPGTAATFTVAGSYVLRLTASDGARATSDDVTVNVAFVNQPPAVSAGADQALVAPISTATLTGAATDDGLPEGSVLSLLWTQVAGPSGVVFGTPHAATTTASFPAVGSYLLRLTASDGASSSADDVIVTVTGAAPSGPPPAVGGLSLQEGQAVTAPTQVTGTVTSNSLLRWVLEMRSVGETGYSPLASGATATVSATLDPTMLLNGLTEVRLTAADTAGRSASTSVNVVVKENQKVGNFTVAFVDLEVPVSGLPIRLTRTYDSRDKRSGDFGYGWRLDVSSVRVQESGVAGSNWQGAVVPGFFPTYCLQQVKPQVVTVTMPDGKALEFEPVLTPACQTFVPIQEATLSFRPRPGTQATLAPAGDGFVWVEGGWPGLMQLFDGADFSVYDPSRYRLTLPDGRIFEVEQGSGLKKVTDTNGNTLTITPAGITHSSGKGVAFTRDGQGRITTITDPAGNPMTYGYDANGDLGSFTDRESNATTFTYEPAFPHHLKGIQDPLGRTPLRNNYDDSGRLVSHVDTYGKTIEYTHSLGTRQEIVQDRNGKQRVLEYDQRGNVVRETDPNGKVVLRSFDARNNRLSETEPHDPVTTPNPPAATYVYDSADNLLSVTDPETHTTEYTYNARRQVLTAKDPKGTHSINAYDPKGNLTSAKVAASLTGPPLSETGYTYDTAGNLLTQTVTVDGVAQVTGYQYDTHGNLTKETDALGHETTYTYDANGNRLTQTTTRTTFTCTGTGCAPSGTETLTTTYEYDKLGRLKKTTDPDTSFTQTVYDALGKQVESYDKLGRKTSYSYDDMGRLLVTTYPDTTTEESTYDGEGRRLTSKDRAGRITSYLYDDLGRLTKTTYPDTASAENTYDDAGRLVSTKDARGKTTFYEYDRAGRRTKVRAPLSATVFAETVFTYDANGNQKTVRDPNGATTTFDYDEQNRRIRTTFPPARPGDTPTYTETTYDTLGRRVAERDQAGKVTRFQYDKLGRLSKVIDALTHETSYGYDELGNRIRQTDANSHVTSFEYDKLGRETARILPDGSRETKTYDAAGTLKTRTDFMGRTTTYDYDTASRLVSRVTSTSTETFTYTASGRRLTATDARGITEYGYDLRDRLASLSQPGVGALGYAYDSNGNRTGLTATIGTQVLTTTSTYDDANRLDIVTDPAARTYDHGYDANGNRSSLVYPNGTQTAYAYDTVNRLTNLTTTRPISGVTIQSYALTLGPTGNRTKIVEHDGTVRDYGYDDLYRLTSEAVTISGLTQYGKTFLYDSVGNRQTQATTGSGAPGTPTAPGTVGYGYDTRDRITTEGSQAYAWDLNGNLTSKDAEATYVWDFENRLTRVTKLDGTVVAHVYDADGNRVQTKTTPPGGPTTTTNFLLDTSGSLSHVVAETDDVGALKAYYVRGDDLLAVMRPLVPVPTTPAEWQTRFVHADGLGSVRRLTDENGLITDGYSYTAFGELLAHTGTDPQPYTFAGEPYDPNVGFQYHRARWMDPRVGRFASLDDLAGRDEDPASLHKYLYAAANPVDRIDPTGHDWNLPSLATVSASISTLAAIYAPKATAIFLTVAQILAPAELGVLPQQIGILQLRGAVASSGPIVVQELGTIRRALTALGGKATGPLGIAFEKWIGRFLRPGVRQQVAVLDGVEMGVGSGSGSRAGAAILDYVDDATETVYEVKASFSAVKYNQALQAGKYAARSGRQLVYVFLKKPNQTQLNQLAEWIGDGASEVGGSAQVGVSSVF